MLKGRLGLETARIPHVDRHGLIKLERGQLSVRAGTLLFTTAGTPDGLAAGEYDLPFQRISAILIGPGTSVTHDVLRLLARHGTGLFATGSGQVRHYASLPFGPDDSARARRHATKWADPAQRLQIAKAMYRIRFGEALPQMDLAALRGIEGARVKATYRLLAEQYGLEWRGRRYDRANPDASDHANQAINHAASAVLAAATIAVGAAGALPQLGFIHEDSGVAFALDIADLFRATVTLPIAFAAAKDAHALRGGPLERNVRRRAAQQFRAQKVIPKMIDRIKELLDGDDGGGDP